MTKCAVPATAELDAPTAVDLAYGDYQQALAARRSKLAALAERRAAAGIVDRIMPSREQLLNALYGDAG